MWTNGEVSVFKKMKFSVISGIESLVFRRSFVLNGLLEHISCHREDLLKGKLAWRSDDAGKSGVMAWSLSHPRNACSEQGGVAE